MDDFRQVKRFMNNLVSVLVTPIVTLIQIKDKNLR